MKSKNMIMPIDEEKASEKVQHPDMIKKKPVNKLGIDVR